MWTKGLKVELKKLWRCEQQSNLGLNYCFRQDLNLFMTVAEQIPCELLVLPWSCDLAAHCTVQRSRNWSIWQGLLPSVEFWHIHLNIMFLYSMPIYALNNGCFKKKQKMEPTCFGGSKVFIKVFMYDGSTLWCRCSNMRRVCLWTFSLLEISKHKQEIGLKNEFTVARIRRKLVTENVTLFKPTFVFLFYLYGKIV